MHLEANFPIIQAHRHANLELLLAELNADLPSSVAFAAEILGLHPAVLAGLRGGADIRTPTAREVEWVMHRPAGWLDRRPGTADV